MGQRFRSSDNSDWGAFPTQAMYNETRDFSIRFGKGKGSLGDIYDFDAQGTDLQGDVGGEGVQDLALRPHCSLGGCQLDGSVTALHDAIALADLIYAMPMTTEEEITKMFEEYQAEPQPAVLGSFKNSRGLPQDGPVPVLSRAILELLLLSDQSSAYKDGCY
ncbi:hypothetical protein KI688_005722 [Linnemannia hyalina]|uniref:Uncharacterized protein n=1 Tax=Linnemannia hyalina TaxID=64524 RepID=A0A9P7Y229_9FUNG|nr:hypothetical protein KI688_005722 [Linnemannia hyalina]